jgi:hypothetical protein
MLLLATRSRSAPSLGHIRRYHIISLTPPNASCEPLTPSPPSLVDALALLSFGSIALVGALLPFVPPNLFLPRSPAVRPRVVGLSGLVLLLVVDLDKPLVLALLVLALVAPSGNPLTGRLVVNQLGLVVVVLGDALLLREELPLGGRLLGGDGLFAGQRGGARRKHEVHAIGRGLDVASAEQLVDEDLGGIAGVGSKGVFVGVAGDGVGVVRKQVAQVERVGRGLVDGDWPAPGQCQ